MPYKEREIQKQYYSMGEITEMFGVNASQIRFYEKEFDVIQPKKNKKGNRMFTPSDIEHFKIIFQLVNEKGYTLKGAKDFLKNNGSEARNQQKIIDSLLELKTFLEQLGQSL